MPTIEKKPMYKLMTDLDKTFQPASEVDRESLIILGKQIVNSKSKLSITPVTGRPVGYVPAILEQTNNLFTNYDLPKPCKFGYGESGMIQSIPISAEYQKFIFEHDKKIIAQTKEIKKTIIDTLSRFGLKVDRDFITDEGRKYSVVIQPNDKIMKKWKESGKEKVLQSIYNDSNIGDLVNCFRNDNEAIQVDHKELNKAKTLAFDVIQDIKNGELIDSFAYACDGENDLDAAKWTVSFGKSVDSYKHAVGKGALETKALKSVLLHFKGFEKLIDRETAINLKDNLKNGFKNINVFLPKKVNYKLIQLGQENPKYVIKSNKNILTGVLDGIKKSWNFKLDLSYDTIQNKINSAKSLSERTRFRREFNSYRGRNLMKIDELSNTKPKVMPMLKGRTSSRFDRAVSM